LYAFENVEVNEARSISKIQKDWSETTTKMSQKVIDWKEAEGDRKTELLDELKALTKRKSELEKELDTKVAGKDRDVQLAISEDHSDNPNDKYEVRPCDEEGTPFAVWEGDVRVECFATEEEAQAFADKQNKEQGLDEASSAVTERRSGQNSDDALILIQQALQGMKNMKAEIKGDTVIISNKAKDEFIYSLNDGGDVQEFIDELEESVANEAFSRMSNDAIGNELYAASQALTTYYDWLKAGNDAGKGKSIDHIISLLKKCKSSIKRFDNKEETIGTEYEAPAMESVVTEAKFVKDFNRDVLNAKTKEEVLELYPNAEFFIGKSDHFFGELDGNLFFKAYYTKGQKEFEIKSVYSEKGSNYVHLYNESVVTEAKQAPAKKLFKMVVNGSTSEIEGVKISKDMAQAALDWYDRSPYARKYDKQVQSAGMGVIGSLIFGDNWGIKKRISSKLKAEFKELQKQYKREVAESNHVLGLDSFLVETKVYKEAILENAVRDLHFETDPKKAEDRKIAIGKSQGEVSKKKQIDGGNYSLRRFRKEIGYGKGDNLDVFIPGSYDAVISKLGDGPHKKAVKKVKWTQKKYDQWLEDMASNGGAKNAFDMAQNAKNEPGLIDWVKKQFRGDDPMQRIQWDIEAFAESVIIESIELADVYDLISHHRFNKDFKKLSSKDKEWVESDAEERGFTESLTIESFNSLWGELNEAKPGPDGYMTGLDDEDKEDKEDAMKKQAEMDDDDPDAYKELPGDKEAQEKGKVKTSKHVKSYHELYGDKKDESMNEDLSMKIGKIVAITKYNPRKNRKELVDVKITDYIKKPGSKDFVEYELKGKKSKVSINVFKSIMESNINEEKAEGDRGPISDDAIETGLKNKSKETGVPIALLRLVMRRGLAAWKSGHRPGATQQQWGYARVNSFLTKQPGTWGGADSDIAKEVRDGGHDSKLKKA